MTGLVERERELAAICALLDRGGGGLTIEGGAGIGKTALLNAACARAAALGHRVLRARGSQLEAGFAFGVVRQLFERTVAHADPEARDALLAGPATAALPLLEGAPRPDAAGDTSFAVLHGLYWLAANLASPGPVLVAVDDVHWADAPSLRWLAYLAPRLAGLPVMLVVAARPLDPASSSPPLLAVRGEGDVVRPGPLSVTAVGALVRRALAGDAGDLGDALCAAIHGSCGGNPFLALELVRAIRRQGVPPEEAGVAGLLAVGQEQIARRVVAQALGVDAGALALAQAAAVLGDGCELRHAAAIADLPVARAEHLVEELVRLELLAPDEALRFVHPVLREALEGSMRRAERDRAHRHAARLLHADGAPAGRVAAHLIGVRPAGDGWALARLREAAAAAMDGGSPASAAGLLRRALAEPPPAEQRAGLLRQAAHAAASAGQQAALALLEEALGLAVDVRQRAEIALEVAQAHSALFRWVEAVDVLERALRELGDVDPGLAARLEGELVVSGLHDARRAARVEPVLARLASRAPGRPGEAPAVARAMIGFLRGRPAGEVAAPLESVLERSLLPVRSWDTRAALLWVLVACERFETVQSALTPLLEDVRRSGSARGLVAVHSTLGLLRLRLGALPEADGAARVALAVLEEGDFAPGLGFAATVLSDVAVQAGQLGVAQTLLELLPQEGWPAGVGTVLIPAARGRLRLAQGRPAEALSDFTAALALFDRSQWGMEIRDTGYTHARSGAALALVRLGEPERARALADAELADVRAFGGPRAIGVALRAAGLARGREDGPALLAESVTVLRRSPAVLERAHSLVELGAALRRAGERVAARGPLGEALDLAARCGAPPLAARAREELSAAGARPRRTWRTGVEALTPGELRVARLAARGRANREIAHELYVTLKTVEGHLGRVYAKLGIAGRPELAGALGGKDQGPTL